MAKRLGGAVICAGLICAIVIWPLLVLPVHGDHNRPLIMTVALFAGVVIFAEYVARTPSLIEFRHAPPYNSIRFIGFAATLIMVTLAATDGRINNIAQPPTWAPVTFYGGYGTNPLSRVVSFGLGAACVMVTSFGISLLFKWPENGQRFNVWENLPMFYVSTSVSKVPALRRHAAISTIWAILSIIAFPLIWYVLDIFFPLTSSVTILSKIWMVTIWAFLPANLIMRAIALWRVAQVVEWQEYHPANQS